MTLNIDNIQRVRDFIAQMPAARAIGYHRIPAGPQSFSMSFWWSEYSENEICLDGKRLEHPCGTVMCIGGTAEFVLNKPQFREFSAKELLGLDSNQAGELFYLDSPFDIRRDDRWKATPERVVRVLDHLIATGDVDWTKGGYRWDGDLGHWIEEPLS